jgi:hypothetical protein
MVKAPQVVVLNILNLLSGKNIDFEPYISAALDFTYFIKLFETVCNVLNITLSYRKMVANKACLHHKR